MSRTLDPASDPSGARSAQETALSTEIERRRLQLEILGYFLIMSLAIMLVLALISLSAVGAGLAWVWQTYTFRVLFIGFIAATVLYIASEEREQRVRNRTLTQEIVDTRESLQRGIDRMAFASEISDILASVRDADTYSSAVDQALKRALEFYTAAGAAVVHHAPGSSDGVELVISLGPDSPLEQGVAEDSVVRIAMRVAQAGGPFLFDGADEDASYFQETGISSAIGIPLRIGERLHSVLCLWTDEGHRHFSASDLSAFRILAHQLELALARSQLLQDKDAIVSGVVRTLSMLSESRDHARSGHGENVARLATAIGRRLKMPPSDLESLRIAGMLHDIGLVSLPEGMGTDTVLMTNTQLQLYRQHPLWGAQMLLDVHFPEQVADAVLKHHERYDGSGYPRGLAGRATPLSARVLAVADEFEALTSRMRGDRALSTREALSEIRSQEGAAFDPRVVAALGQAVAEAEEIAPEPLVEISSDLGASLTF